MAETRKVLGQLEVPSAVLTAVYTVPALTQAVVSTFTVCNRGSAARKFRLSIAVAGEADALKQYSYYDQNVPKNTTFAGTIGMTLGAGDIIRVYGSNVGLSINIFGVEIT